MRKFALFVSLILLPTSLTAGAKTLNIRDFGAKGDGATDDYAAMQAAAAAVCAAPGSTLVYPAGHYHIARYKIMGGPQRNSVQDIVYSGCQNVTILGTGATIDVFGAFARSADVVQGNVAASYENSVTPFRILHSRGFTISGFTIQGNVDKMTRPPQVYEGDVAGIETTDCHDYTLLDLRVSGFATDGITLGANSALADTNATLTNVVSENNARQGISVLQVNQALISHSFFSASGRTGAYGGHLPMAGADVEPMRAPPQEDFATDGIVFDSCTFSENLGFQMVSEVPALVGLVTVQNSTVIASLPDDQPGAFLNGASEAIVQNTEFYIGAGHAVELGPDSASQYRFVRSALYLSNMFYLASKTGLYPPSQPLPVRLENNRIQVASNAPDSQMMVLQNIAAAEANQFFIVGSLYSGSTGTQPYEVVYQHVPSIRNNSYATDLTNGTFYTIYYGAGLAPQGESFGSHWKPVTLAH